MVKNAGVHEEIWRRNVRWNEVWSYFELLTWMFTFYQYSENPSGEKPWLCGQNFTIADIYLSTLLHRMVLAGQKERLWGNGYRPLIANYYDRVRHRHTFQESCMWANEVYSSVILPMMTYKARKSAPYVIGFAAAAVGITIAAMIYYKGFPSIKRWTLPQYVVIV